MIEVKGEYLFPRLDDAEIESATSSMQTMRSTTELIAHFNSMLKALSIVRIHNKMFQKLRYVYMDNVIDNYNVQFYILLRRSRQVSRRPRLLLCLRRDGCEM